MSKYAEIISLQRREPLISVSSFVNVREKVVRSIFQSARLDVLMSSSSSEEEDDESSSEDCSSSLISGSCLFAAAASFAFVDAEVTLLLFDLDDIIAVSSSGC